MRSKLDGPRLKRYRGRVVALFQCGVGEPEFGQFYVAEYFHAGARDSGSSIEKK